MENFTNCLKGYRFQKVTFVIVNYKYFICQQKLDSIYSNVIICFILTPFLTLPSLPLLPSPLKLQNITTPKRSIMSVCADLASLSYT